MQGQNDSYDTIQRKKREARVRERCQYFVDQTDLSFDISNWVVQDILIEEEIVEYLINKKIDSLLTQNCASNWIETTMQLITKGLNWYDFEQNVTESEDIEPSEPKSSSLDLWSKENAEVYKIPVKISPKLERKSSSKSSKRQSPKISSKSLISKFGST